MGRAIVSLPPLSVPSVEFLERLAAEGLVIDLNPGAALVDVIDPTGEVDVRGELVGVDELEATVDCHDPLSLVLRTPVVIEVREATVIDAEAMPDSLSSQPPRDGFEREPAVVSGEVGDIELPKRPSVAAAVTPQCQVERTEVEAGSADSGRVRDSSDSLLVARAGVFARAAVLKAAALASESHYRALPGSSLPVGERIMADTTRCRGPCISAGAR